MEAVLSKDEKGLKKTDLELPKFGMKRFADISSAFTPGVFDGKKKSRDSTNLPPQIITADTNVNVNVNGVLSSMVVKDVEKEKIRSGNDHPLERNIVQTKPDVVDTLPGKPAKDDEKIKMRAATDFPQFKSDSLVSKFRSGVLTKVVQHMRSRYHGGDNFPLTLDEILEETKQQSIEKSMKEWLAEKALPNNPKIEATSDNTKFAFKPVYKIKNGKTLIRLLKRHSAKGLGGVLLDDVHDAWPKVKAYLKTHGDEILIVTRPVDKKKILFYNDTSADLTVDEDIQKFWRSVNVNCVEDVKIDEYLKGRNISYMKDNTPKTPVVKSKKTVVKRNPFKRQNDNIHLADILETYEDETIEKKELDLINITIC